MARQFLSSQCITTAETFLATKSTTMVNALVDWRRRCDSSECSFEAARQCIDRWKRILRQLQSSRQEASRALDPELDVLSPTGQSILSTQAISTQSDLFPQGLQPGAGPSNIAEWEQAELQEHTAGVETMHGALSCRVSATPPAVNASPNSSRSSLLLQHEEPRRLRTGNTETQLFGSSGQDNTSQTQNAPDETTLGAATATPVSQVSVQVEQAAGPPMCETMHYQVVTQTSPCTLPAVVNETAMAKATEDDNASNDYSIHRQHGDFKGAEPPDDSNDRKPDSKRKRPREESSPGKCRVFGYI
jgi:hypothetical protein